VFNPKANFRFQLQLFLNADPKIRMIGVQIRLKIYSLFHSFGGPSECSDSLLEPGRRRLVIVLSRLAARPEYSQTQVPPLWVRRSHFAVGHFLGFVVFPEPATLGYG
jgi:hypothetical protein